MIGYRVGRRTLKRLIRQHDPDWLRKAENGDRPHWGDIKGVFVRLQHYKCGYCERPMPRPQRPAGDDTTGATWGGRREYDVEHFRPKGRVERWPTAASSHRYPFETGEAMDGGYPWLTHDCLELPRVVQDLQSGQQEDVLSGRRPPGRCRRRRSPPGPVGKAAPRQPGRCGRLEAGGSDWFQWLPRSAARLARSPAPSWHRPDRPPWPQPARRADSAALQPDPGDVAVPRASA